HGEDAERLPFFGFRSGRLLADVGQRGRLLGVLGGAGGGVAVDVHRVALVNDGGAVVDVDGRDGEAAPADQRGPGGDAPGVAGGGPAAGVPAAGIAAVPAGAEAIVVAEAAADVARLRCQGRGRYVIRAPASAGGNDARPTGDDAASAGGDA